jgi:hypothetical protein
MEMFLTIAVMSFLCAVVSAALFGAATRQPSGQPQYSEAPLLLDSPDAQRFFIGDRTPQPRVPIEAFLLQLERHVQLEQAAAESFTYAPTAESLHVRSMSPLVH